MVSVPSILYISYVLFHIRSYDARGEKRFKPSIFDIVMSFNGIMAIKDLA